jgi:hypothetical protein
VNFLVNKPCSSPQNKSFRRKEGSSVTQLRRKTPKQESRNRRTFSETGCAVGFSALDVGSSGEETKPTQSLQATIEKSIKKLEKAVLGKLKLSVALDGRNAAPTSKRAFHDCRIQSASKKSPCQLNRESAK